MIISYNLIRDQNVVDYGTLSTIQQDKVLWQYM